MLPKTLPSATHAPRIWRYGLALLAIVAALLGSLALQQYVLPNPFILFIAAVAFSAWYGGFRISLLMTLLSMLLTNYFLLPPYYVFSFGIDETIRILVFGLVAALISFLSESRRQSELRYAITLASIGDGVIVTDDSGCVTYLNAVAEDLTGWKLAEAQNRSVSEVFRIINEMTRQTVPNPVERVLREGIVVGLANHTLLLTRDGYERPIDDSGAPIRTETGRTIGCILVFRDISERHQADRERMRLLAQAEEAIRMRDTFFSIAAHELRTPITTLKGNIQLLQRRLIKEHSLSERDQRTFRVIDEQAQRLNRMVQALLDVSRLEQGNLSIEPHPLDLGALVGRVVEETQPTLLRHTLMCEGTDGPLMVAGDELRLEQVFLNLINNAVKYSPDGGVVRVQFEQRNIWACVAITDHGIGIPADALPHLFQRFYRATNADSQRLGGLGIGLYVVREILALHNGWIKVVSTEGHGSTFTVGLPLLLKANS